MNQELVKKVSRQELAYALRLAKRNKAPGLDSLIVELYQKVQMIADDMLDTFNSI